MSAPLISNQSVTVQLPATDRVGKLKELLADALKLQLRDYEVFHNGQKVSSIFYEVIVSSTRQTIKFLLFPSDHRP